MDYIRSLPGSTDKFVVKIPGSTVALDSNLDGSNLEENGLDRATTIHVTWIHVSSDSTIYL